MATENALNILTLLLIKPLLIILAIAAGLLLLRKKSAALQHFWVATGLFALLLLPLLFSFLPEIKWQVLSFDKPTSLLVAWLYDFSVWFGEINNVLLITAIYAMGVFWLLFYLLLGICGVALQTRQSRMCDDIDMQQRLLDLREEMGITREVSLRVSNTVSSPQMWGIFRPVIMLPAHASSWTNERKLSVLLHELGHVARCDWATTLAVKICCAFFWFLPPVWWLTNRLFHFAEIACDDYIYRLHNDYQLRNKEIIYAENLLAMAQAVKTPPESALSMAGHSPVFYRIEAILDRQRQRDNATPEARQYWVLVLLLLLLPVASLQLMPIQQTLMAQVLKIQLPDAGRQDSTAVSGKKPVTPTYRLDAETLRKLKQQVRVSEMPRLPQEKLIVTASSDSLDTSGLANRGNLIKPVKMPEPLIHMQGYMPAEMVIPIYPRNALERGTEGEVIVEFSIAEDGTIFDPHILKSHPRNLFDKAVLAALKDSRYHPQIIDGIPVIIEGVTEVFTFQIQQPLIAEQRQQKRRR